MNILVVDDEIEIADLIELYLKNENYNVFKSYSSLKALEMFDNHEIDLAILDIMMPEMDGYTMLSKIREKYLFPVIMVTAKVEDIDKIQGLSLGADDYITKPFTPLELVARVKAQLRRYKRYNQNIEEDIIDFSGLVINNDNHTCTLNEEQLNLTPIEFDILWYLLKNKGRVVKVDELFQNVWNQKYIESSNNTIMVHIRHLREKMNDIGNNPKYIKTVWGVGYKIE
jgi:two-component system response regulator VanR